MIWLLISHPLLDPPFLVWTKQPGVFPDPDPILMRLVALLRASVAFLPVRPLLTMTTVVAVLVWSWTNCSHFGDLMAVYPQICCFFHHC
jgi:hypothetical protein